MLGDRERALLAALPCALTVRKPAPPGLLSVGSADERDKARDLGIRARLDHGREVCLSRRSKEELTNTDLHAASVRHGSVPLAKADAARWLEPELRPKSDAPTVGAWPE